MLLFFFGDIILIMVRNVEGRLHYITEGYTDIIDITFDVANFIKQQDKEDGLVFLFVNGSTAALTTMEYEAGLLEDFKQIMNELVPYNKEYKHHERWQDNNGASHLRASLIGPSLCLPFKSKKLNIGTWQQIVLIDFDTQEREREVIIKII